MEQQYHVTTPQQRKPPFCVEGGQGLTNMMASSSLGVMLLRLRSGASWFWYLQQPPPLSCVSSPIQLRHINMHHNAEW